MVESQIALIKPMLCAKKSDAVTWCECPRSQLRNELRSKSVAIEMCVTHPGQKKRRTGASDVVGPIHSVNMRDSHS